MVSVDDAVRFADEMYKKYIWKSFKIWLFIILSLLFVCFKVWGAVICLRLLNVYFYGGNFGGNFFLEGPLFVVFLVIFLIIHCVCIRFILDVHDTGTTSLSFLLSSVYLTPFYFIVVMLEPFIKLFSLVFNFFVQYPVYVQSFYLASFFVLDKGMWPIAALKQSHYLMSNEFGLRVYRAMDKRGRRGRTVSRGISGIRNLFLLAYIYRRSTS